MIPSSSPAMDAEFIVLVRTEGLLLAECLEVVVVVVVDGVVAVAAC